MFAVANREADDTCAICLLAEFFGQERCDLAHADPLLIRSIAVSDRDGVISHRLAIDREAERSSGLIHAGVALADGLLDVEIDDPARRAKFAIELLALL